jgi:acylphosphatase
MNHLNISVYGKVQGVNFRHYTREKALELGLKGFVENRRDGTVYIEVEGGAVQLEEFVTWCTQGPPRAEVENVETHSGQMRDFPSFDIRRT